MMAVIIMVEPSNQGKQPSKEQLKKFLINYSTPIRFLHFLLEELMPMYTLYSK
jgi:hypothetical protein